MKDEIKIDEQKLQQEIDNEIKQLEDREIAIQKRADKLLPIHEDLVHIHRYGHIDTLTFLELTDMQLKQRRQSSWYGKVVKISEVDSKDDVREFKKKKLKLGDVIIFNPDSAYSLNIPGYEELWIIHIDSVLDVDTAYDYIKSMRENKSRLREIQAKQAALAMQRIESMKNVHNINEGIKKN